MSCSQGICSSFFLSSKDRLNSLRKHLCLCFLYLTRECSFLGHVCTLLAPVCRFSTRTFLFFQQHMFQEQEYFGRPTLEVSLDHFTRVVFQFFEHQVAVLNFTSEIDFFAMRFNHKLLLHVSSSADALEFIWSRLLLHFRKSVALPLILL